ncbi:MAG: fibronectin type III domain-containing protein [Luteolibacter sp.]
MGNALQPLCGPAEAGCSQYRGHGAPDPSRGREQGSLRLWDTHLHAGWEGFSLSSAARPPAPTKLAAAAGIGCVELSWTAPPDDAAQGYEIRRSSSPEGPFESIYRTTTNTSTSWVDTKVANGTRYRYEIAAINQSGTSGWSTRAEATPVAAGELPAGWAFKDIGGTEAEGSASYARAASASIQIRGAGQGIGGRSDSCGFAGRKIEGDFTFIARLADVDWKPDRCRVGLMVRESLEPGSKGAFITLGDIGARQTRFGVRKDQGGNTAYKSGNDYTWVPVWFRIQRAGDKVSAAHSMDGVTWFEVGSETLAMPSSVYMGFAASSQDPKQTLSATFDRITFSN